MPTYRIISNGTLLALQNLTWSGAQGFSTPPTRPLIGVDGAVAAHYVTERGLTYAAFEEAGHAVPTYQPAGSLKLIRYLLGQVDRLST